LIGISIKIIDKCIPLSITHLTFGTSFNKPIQNNIPSSVTHLTLGHNFKQPLIDIPPSIKQIKISDKYVQYINERISSRTEIIRFKY